MYNSQFIIKLLVGTLIILLVVVSACIGGLPGQTDNISVSPITPIQPTDPKQASIFQAWQNSKHAATFILSSDGSNNDCARCHSPYNWIPTANEDIPATCASCKFTIKIPKPVAKTDWKSIECNICHRVENGNVGSQVFWLNAAIAQFDTTKDPYEAVTSNTQLCEKCHKDSNPFFYKIDMGSTAHIGKQCTACHDAHVLKASCTAAGCHADILTPAKPIEGHDAAHANVNCVACHDASGLKVGPVEGQKTWLTFRTTEVQGKKSTSSYLSHNLQKKVDCARCHFVGNTWGLKAITK